MKKTYINPTCKVRAMKIEAIMAETAPVEPVDPIEPGGIIGGGDGSDIGWGGTDNGGGGDANKSVWDK